MGKERYLSRNVAGERHDQYGARGVRGETPDQRADDLRRLIILKHAGHPSLREKGIEPINLWQNECDDIKRHFGSGQGVVGIDAGTSSGYLPELLLESGYQGSLLACDMYDHHLPRVQTRLKNGFSAAFQQADIRFGQADAEKLNQIRLIDGQVISIPDSCFDFYISNNVVHHTPSAENLVAEAVRVTKPGGWAYFMARAVGHFNTMYQILETTANFHHATAPVPYYALCDFYRLREIIESTPELELTKTVPQADFILIEKADEAGWKDYSAGLYTHLPAMRKKTTGRRLRKAEIAPFIEGPVKKAYLDRADEQGGYLTDYVFQCYFETMVKK